MMVTFGGGWNDIAYRVGCVVLLTMILFIIGVLLFSRN
jgi:ABC-2 type transport system permease protein